MSEPGTFDSDARPVQDLIKSLSIDSLLRKRVSILTRIDQSLTTLNEANQLAKSSGLGDLEVSFTVFGQPFSLTSSRISDILRQQVDAGGWQFLMNESGLQTFMDSITRKKWNDQLTDGDDVPELTAKNIEATFTTIHASRRDMFERGVITIFRRLSWDYKTNQPCKFGKRIILTGFLGHGTGHYRHINHHTTNELDDLMRVFYILDGRPEPDHRHGMYHTLAQAQAARLTEWVGDYFSLRWFNKGTVHVAFKRLDLVDDMNRILAKHYPDALASGQRKNGAWF